MKSKILLVAAMLVGAFTASAQDDYRFGYCDNSESISDKNVSMNGAQTLEAATQILGEDLTRFTNGKITGINVGLSTRYNVSSIRAWLRDALTGQDIASAEITPGTNPSLKDGWNAVKFDTPVNIENGKNYYAGYTMTLTKVSSIAIIGRQTGSHAESCWLKVGNGEWTDHSSDYGLLTVELLVQSDNLPQYDLELTRATSFDTYLTNGKSYTVQYDIHNAGVKPVTSYTLRLSDEKNGVNVTKEMTCDLKTDERQKKVEENFIFTNLIPERTYNFTLSIEKPDGQEDETPDNNSIALPSISSINKMFERTVLVEEFTTERCVNCPPAANNVHTMLSSFSEEQQKRVAVVCHHAGFYEDFLTQPCDRSYLVFYPAYPETYCPAIMYDRAKGSTGAPVVGTQSASGMKNTVSNRMAEEAFYSISATGTHDAAARKINIRIDGKSAANVFKNPRITVYLLEDNVESYRQTGGTTGYKHNHVIRAYNAIWGISPAWDDDFTYHYTTTLSYPETVNMATATNPKYQTLNPENFQIVAVISNYDADDKNNCEVGNVFKCKLSELAPTNPSGVTINTADAANVRVYAEAGSIMVDGAYDSVEVYDLSGRKAGMDNLPAGIYLVRVNTADGNVQAKVLVK